MMIVDSHVHVRPGMSDAEADALAAALRHGGVSMAVVSSVGSFERYPQPEVVRASNDASAAFAARHPDLAVWLAYVNPQNADWPQELARCLEAGAAGIKLWISLKDAAGSLERAGEAIAHAAERGLPLLVHTFANTDGNEPGEVTIAELVGLARRVPDARIVAAHAGGNWRQTAGVAADVGNVCVDVCGCFPERGMAAALVGELGAERVLFGSDMPGRSLPSQLAKVLLADLSDADREAVLWRNAARVFGLDVRPQDAAAPCECVPERELPDPTVDHYCFCGQWPFFDAACHAPEALDWVLKEAGVNKGYAADLGGMFRLDLERANGEFARLCEPCEHVAPLATVNPRAVNWRAVLAQAPANAAGVFASPYLHNWRLDDAAHAAFFEECARASLPVWVNCALGDQRFRHTGMAWRPVAAGELAGFLAAAPPGDYVLQGLSWHQVGPAAEALLGRPDVRLEISRLTDLHGHLNAAVSAGLLPRLAMGSEWPLRDAGEVMWTARRLPPDVSEGD